MALDVFFMSHLLEVIELMITITILPATCINTIWQGQKSMRHSNNKNACGEYHENKPSGFTRNIIKNAFQTLLTIYGEFIAPAHHTDLKEAYNDDIFQDLW
jgi:hypothetical protein